MRPNQGDALDGIDIPRELYWVISEPTPLAGMKLPRHDFPWASLGAAGFSKVISLHLKSFNPAPLEILFAGQLEDLVGGGPPSDAVVERHRVRSAVNAALGAWRSGQGVVVHCVGGRGRSGTVLGCVLRELGFAANDVLSYLDELHKARGKPGWPESSWQSGLVESWMMNEPGT